MTAASQPSANPGADLARRIVAAWNRFWFSPGDPLPLGFIRICAGLLYLYIHLAYTGDLQELVGPHAWLDLRVINSFRLNSPWIAHGLNTFADPAPRFPLSPEDQQKLRQHNAQNMDDVHRLEKEGVLQLTPEQEKDLAYYVDWGWDPKQPEVIAKGHWYFSLWLHVTDPNAMLALHVGFLAILFLFTIGFCTRITSVLTWVGLVSYIQRTPNSVFGVDTMMNIVALYLMIGPSGAAMSVDRLFVRYWATWRALRGQRRVPDLKPLPLVSANLALRLLQVHVCFIYLASGLSKLLGNAWWNGTATWYTMANPEFSPLRFQWYTDFIQFQAMHPWIWYLNMAGSVAFTLFFEISFAYLIWRRSTRWFMLGMAVLLHTGIALFMGLVTFSLMMCCFLMAFVPPEVCHRVLARFGRGLAHLRLAFNGRQRGQVRAAALVHAFDAWQQVELVRAPAAGGAQDGGRLELVTDNGIVLSGYPLFERLVRALPLLRPVGLVTYLPGVKQVASGRFPGTRQAAANGDRLNSLAEKEPAAAVAGKTRT